MCVSLGRYRSWHYSSGCSDHRSIILQLDFNLSKALYPFKFNPTWLSVVDFNSLVTTEWAKLKLEVPPHLSPIYALIFKLSKLRQIVRNWEIKVKKMEDESLLCIEHEISRLEAI